MQLDRNAFAFALGLGLLTIGSYTVADGPGGPSDEMEVQETTLPPGTAIMLGGPGFMGTPGPGEIGEGASRVRVAATLREGAIEVTAKRVDAGASGAAPALDLVAYTLEGSLASRMGPTMIECFRAPLDLTLDAKSGAAIARVALAKSLPAGALVMVEAHGSGAPVTRERGAPREPFIVFNENDANGIVNFAPVSARVFVLAVPAEETKS